jgi:N-acetylmuramoyl-L-alanine amidase
MWKINEKKILALMLVLSMFLPFFQNTHAETLRYAVVSPTINVRNATSENGEIVYVIKTAGEYLILAESKDNTNKIWYKIKVSSNLSGFIASWVVDSIRISEKETPVSGKIAIIEPGVKIRLSPSLDGEIHQIVNELVEKQILTEIKDGENRTWYKILLNDGLYGWVASWVITVKAPKDEKKSASDKLIIAENINIRKGPGMGFDIVAHISTKVEARGIYEANDNEGKVWFLIRLPNNVEGWAASWVVDVKQYSENKKSITGKTARIEPIVNVREGPSTQAKIVKTITVTSEYPILSQGNDINGKPWYEIMMENNLKGWVASWVVEVKISGNGNETIEPLNMRSGPGTNYDKILEVPINTAFTILGYAFNSNKDVWYAVNLQQKNGWILGSQTKVSI